MLSMPHVEEEAGVREVFGDERGILIMWLACTFHKARGVSWFGSALSSSTEGYSQALCFTTGIQPSKSLGFLTGR